jgi:hypothetical protein
MTLAINSLSFHGLSPATLSDLVLTEMWFKLIIIAVIKDLIVRDRIQGNENLFRSFLEYSQRKAGPGGRVV